MLVRNLVLSFVLIASACLCPAWAQESKITVSVDHSGDDNIGVRLAFAVREAIRASSGYRLVSENAVLRISLITIDPERSPAAGGVWTVAAISYTMRNDLPLDKSNPQTWYPINLSASVITAGYSRVDDQAKAVLAGLDKQVDLYRRSARGN